MKTNCLIHAFALSILLTISASAQSSFHFQNLVPFAGVDAPVFEAGGVRLTGATYAAELWGGATSDSLSPTLDFSSGQRLILPFLTGTGAGYFTSVNAMTVFGTPGGGYAWVQVRAWDTRLGATYEDAMVLSVGGYGQSSLLYILGGNPLTPTIPNPLVGLQSFSLLPVVPEPSTWALLALGGAGVWLAVWRKRKRFR